MDDDQQLLARYVEHADQAAFAALARRHAGLVYSAARRRLGDGDLAHDVTQVVFLVLARRAGTIRPGTVLSAWLLKATRYTASNLNKTEFRRRRREQEAALRKEAMVKEAAQTVAAGNDWERVAPLLDDALDSLGEAGRSAVVLRWFEGRSFKEVGERLGVSEEAAKQKVFRALGRMKRYFGRKGVIVPTAALATLIAANATQAAPVATMEAAVAAGMPGAVVAAGSQAAVQTVASLMGWTKAKVLVGSLAAALVLSGGVIAIKRVLFEDRGSYSAARQLAVPVYEAPKGPITRPAGKVMTSDGRPLAGALVLLSTESEPAAYHGKPDAKAVKTGADGSFSFPPSNEPYTLIFWHDDAGFAEATDDELAQGNGRVTLQPWARIEGKALVGAAPAANATVVAGHWARSRDGVEATTCTIEVQADAEGRYVFPRVPAGNGWVARQVTAPIGPSVLVHRTYVTAQPAKKVDLQIGGAKGCRTVIGKFEDKSARAGDGATRTWRMALVRTLDAPANGNAGVAAYSGAMFETGLVVAADGSFRAEDVPAGSYRLVGKVGIALIGEPILIGVAEQLVQVTPAADNVDASPPQDLGTIAYTLPPVFNGDAAATKSTDQRRVP